MERVIVAIPHECDQAGTLGSYVYGTFGSSLEQISSGGTATYLHRDQAGSTRLLTGSTGTVIGKCTYSAYGTPTCEGTTTTPLGYDGEYGIESVWNEAFGEGESSNENASVGESTNGCGDATQLRTRN